MSIITGGGKGINIGALPKKKIICGGFSTAVDRTPALSPSQRFASGRFGTIVDMNQYTTREKIVDSSYRQLLWLRGEYHTAAAREESSGWRFGTI